MYALYPNGKLKWKYATGDVFTSPAIGEDGTIYFGSGSYAIIALFPNGTLRWKYSTNAGVYSSPAIGQGGTIYCGCLDTYIYALNPTNGTLIWKFKTGYMIRTSPCIANDGTIYCVSRDGYLYALNPDGSMKWRTDVGAGTSPTIGLDGTIYAGWDYLHAINPLDGSIKWKVDALGDIEGGTPCIARDGTIYYGTVGHGNITARYPDGSLKWSIAIGQCESAPAIGEDGTIYVGSEWFQEYAYFYALGPGEPKKIKVLKPKQGYLNVLGAPIFPTLLHRTIVIGPTMVKVKVFHEDELVSVTFLIGDHPYYVAWSPPYEWLIYGRFSDYVPDWIDLNVVGYYKGGCSWRETIRIEYFALIKR